MTTTLRGCTISFPALIAVTTAIAIHPTALGQWKVTNLHPAGATQSFANSTTGTQVVGWANVPRAVGSAMHASLWSSSADSWVDLNPADAFSSIVSYAFEGQQAGTAYLGSGPNPHAGLWSNSSASWTDLHPVGQMASSIGATSHAQQVGWTAFSFGQYHACLWSGSAASWVNLHPAGNISSWAYGVDGGQQFIGRHIAIRALERGRGFVHRRGVTRRICMELVPPDTPDSSPLVRITRSLTSTSPISSRRSKIAG